MSLVGHRGQGIYLCVSHRSAVVGGETVRREAAGYVVPAAAVADQQGISGHCGLHELSDAPWKDQVRDCDRL